MPQTLICSSLTPETHSYTIVNSLLTIIFLVSSKCSYLCALSDSVLLLERWCPGARCWAFWLSCLDGGGVEDVEGGLTEDGGPDTPGRLPFVRRSGRCGMTVWPANEGQASPTPVLPPGGLPDTRPVSMVSGESPFVLLKQPKSDRVLKNKKKQHRLN